MAEEDPKEPKAPKGTPAEDSPVPEPEPLPEPEPAPAPAVPDPAAADPHFTDAINGLQELGLHLPAGTTLQNLCERISVACLALKKGGGGEGEDEDDTYDKPPGEQPGGPVVEEQRPVMMSLAGATTATERRLLEREQDRRKKSIAARIDKLVKKGMPVFEANAYRAQAAGYELSLDGEGEPVPRRVELDLDIWEKALRHSKFPGAMLGADAGVAESPRPDVEGDRKAQEDAGDELAALAGAPVRKK